MFRKITQLIKWRQARHLVAGFIYAEMSSVLRLQPGSSDDVRRKALASDPSLPAIIIGAFPTSGADPGVLASSLKMMESKRAAETADIVLVNSNPKDIVNLILFGKATYRKMIQNLSWATGYNIIAMPLAAGVLYQAGVMLSPAVGAVLMSVSTIVVAINARLLRV